MKKLIFLCVRYRIRLLSKIYHSISLIGEIIRHGGNLSKRSPVLFNRAITYIPYIQSEKWLKSVYDGLNEEDTTFIQESLRKIEYIAYHNIVDYNELYSYDDELEQQSYLKYFYKQPQENYFKRHGYGLVNEYCIQRDMKKFNFDLGNKDILDCGAYIGDSGIAFSAYFPNSKVYACEPDEKNFKQLEEILTLYNIHGKIIPLKIGVGEKDMNGYLSDEGIGSKISTTGAQISIRSIDSLVDEYNLTPGLIKWDIEGFEYYSLLGAVETLKKHKPILFISVYHHGRDLFEVKKLIQDLDIGYNFTFTRWDSMTAFSDTLLVCY